MKKEQCKMYLMISRQGNLFISEEQFKIIEKSGAEIMFKNREVDDYKSFTLTSKEMDLCSYEKDLELLRYSNLVKTKDKIFKLNGKNVTKKDMNEIITSLHTPLDLLEKEYNFEITDNDEKIIEKLKAEKHFEMMAIDEEVFQAVCYLIYQKTFMNEHSSIFISLNELHRELGYNSKLKEEDKQYYKKILTKLNYLRININIEKSKYREYKKFYKVYDNIEGEPLIYLDYFKKRKQYANKTIVLREGFITRKTQLMILYTEFTKRFYVSPLECKTKIKHSSRLKNYLKRLYFIDRKNKRPFLLNIGTIFNHLSEFNLKDEYLKTNRKKEFLERKIFKLIDEMKEVKKITFVKSSDEYKYKFEISWDF
jgi:hypothetical protein